MFNLDLNQTTYLKAIRGAKLFLGTTIAPLWFIFQFANELFFKTDVIKLVIIGSAIGIPVVTLTSSIATVFASGFAKANGLQLNEANLTNEKNAELFFITLGYGATISLIIFYIPCIITYFKVIQLHQAIRISIISYAVLFFYYTRAMYKKIKLIQKEAIKKIVKEELSKIIPPDLL